MVKGQRERGEEERCTCMKDGEEKRVELCRVVVEHINTRKCCFCDVMEYRYAAVFAETFEVSTTTIVVSDSSW